MRWIFSSKAGHEHDQFHHFLMDYDHKEAPEVNMNPKIMCWETLYKTPHGWHVIRRGSSTKKEYRNELWRRGADPEFILALEIDDCTRLFCDKAPLNVQLRYEDLQRFINAPMRKKDVKKV